MFSGLIPQVGTITGNRRNRIEVDVVPFKAKPGDSVAINGVCLTVVNKPKYAANMKLAFEVSAETISKTTIQSWFAGKKVNIEPALKASDALGGHIVQGHVDGVGRVVKIADLKSSREVWFEAPKEIAKFIVKKGSVAVDGVSLTAAEVKKNRFLVSLVPFTLEHTNLKQLKVGDKINLEADVIGKYVAAYMKRK